MKSTVFAIVASLLFLNAIQAAPSPSTPTPPPPTLSEPEKINLNTADAAHLIQSVKGIGNKRAEAIVSYREKHGAFTHLEDLAQVPGIGKQFVRTHEKEINQRLVLK